jgi:hypothetical protein
MNEYIGIFSNNYLAMILLLYTCAYLNSDSSYGRIELLPYHRWRRLSLLSEHVHHDHYANFGKFSAA